jgi:hypothetical protein
MEILVPISLAELYDKISILQIKLNKIKDEEKLKNVINEWNLLVEISEKYPIDDELYVELKKVNIDLWIVEDQLRLKEKNDEFDEGFISLARSVYYHNDERSRIKREINEKYGSSIIEEKSYEKYE